ncbi:hypothetical protein ACTA71_007595 [Dictyostelium dimigraforme]
MVGIKPNNDYNSNNEELKDNTNSINKEEPISGGGTTGGLLLIKVNSQEPLLNEEHHHYRLNYSGGYTITNKLYNVTNSSGRGRTIPKTDNNINKEIVIVWTRPQQKQQYGDNTAYITGTKTKIAIRGSQQKQQLRE